MVVRGNGVQAEFVAFGGVGGIHGGEFQVGSVLDGQNMVVKVGVVGVFHPSRLFGVPLAGLPVFGAGGKRAAHGGERRPLGIRPASELERGQARGGLHGSQNGVGPAQFGVEAVGVVGANLKLQVQFHGLTGEGEVGGLAARFN